MYESTAICQTKHKFKAEAFTQIKTPRFEYFNLSAANSFINGISCLPRKSQMGGIVSDFYVLRFEFVEELHIESHQLAKKPETVNTM